MSAEGIMLNVEKVRLMTQAATCYRKQERTAMRINEFYKRDYINLNVIKAILAFSAAYMIAFVMITIYRLEWLLVQGKRAILTYLICAAALYVVLAIIYGITSYKIFARKYQTAKSEVKKYQQLLSRIDMLHTGEETIQKSKKEDPV